MICVKEDKEINRQLDRRPFLLLSVNGSLLKRLHVTSRSQTDDFVLHFYSTLQQTGSLEVLGSLWSSEWLDLHWAECIMLRGCPAMYCFVLFSCTWQVGLPNWYFCIVVSHEMWAVFCHLLLTDTMSMGRGGQPSWRKNSPAVTWRYRQGEQHKQKAWDCHLFPCHNITWSVQE